MLYNFFCPRDKNWQVIPLKSWENYLSNGITCQFIQTTSVFGAYFYRCKSVKRSYSLTCGSHERAHTHIKPRKLIRELAPTSFPRVSKLVKLFAWVPSWIKYVWIWQGSKWHDPKEVWRMDKARERKAYPYCQTPCMISTRSIEQTIVRVALSGEHTAKKTGHTIILL